MSDLQDEHEAMAGVTRKSHDDQDNASNEGGSSDGRKESHASIGDQPKKKRKVNHG